MCICLTVALFSTIFPLFSAVYISFDKRDRLFKFAFSLFGITVFKYNAIINACGFTVKKTFKKPYSVVWADLIGKPSFTGVSVLKHISVLSVDLKADIGLDGTSALMLISSVNIAAIALSGIIGTLKPSAEINDELNVYCDSTALHAFLRVKTVFNLLDILTIFTLKIWGKIKYAIGKQNKLRS